MPSSLLALRFAFAVTSFARYDRAADGLARRPASC
jgi:hypothetical protein